MEIWHVHEEKDIRHYLFEPSHVECFKPPDMQTAVWYARRMEKVGERTCDAPMFGFGN